MWSPLIIPLSIELICASKAVITSWCDETICSCREADFERLHFHVAIMKSDCYKDSEVWATELSVQPCLSSVPWLGQGEKSFSFWKKASAFFPDYT